MQASILVLSYVHSVTVFNVPVYTGEKTLLFSALEFLCGDSLLIASLILNYYYSYMYNLFSIFRKPPRKNGHGHRPTQSQPYTVYPVTYIEPKL
jgi:hypothetical protein